MLSKRITSSLRHKEERYFKDLVIAKSRNSENHSQISYGSPLDGEFEWSLLQFATIVFYGAIIGPVNDGTINDFEIGSGGLAGLDFYF